MEPIFNAPNTSKAIEVMFFEEAEVTKMRGGQPSFATFGPMSVLYLPSYNRFVLHINGWNYPILRRASLQSGANGSYTLPGPNGSTFDLKVKGQNFSNLDSLFEGSRKLESSPDDKLARLEKKVAPNTGVKEVISENIKSVVKKAQTKIATMKTGTKYLTSTKRRIDMKSIKNKNFKKEAHSKIKKDFFSSSEKHTSEFSKLRQDNLNLLSQPKSFDDLRKISHAAVFYLPKAEIEEAILRGKDAAPQSKPVEGSRDRVAPQSFADKTPIAEGMTHYQG